MRAANPGHAFGTVVVDELARLGLSDACIAPGSRSAPLAMAFAADDRIRTHVVLDERSASYLALGIARAGRRPVAMLCTSGTAAANFYPAVVEAHEARVPLLVLTADRPPELRHTAANQTIDQIKLYGDAVRWFCEVGVPEARPTSVRYWRSLIARAWAGATGSPPGPVHLNLALREPLVPIDEGGFPYPLDGRAQGRPWTEVGSRAHAPRDEDVDRLAERVSNTEAGVIVVGASDVDAGPILRLASAAAWPILAEPTSGVRTGDNAVSSYDALLRVDLFRARHRPQFIVRIGRHGLSKALAAFLDANIPQVLVDRDGAWLDPDRAAAEVIACDPAELCVQVEKALTPRGESAWLASWRQAERRARASIDNVLDAHEEPSEPRAARDLAAALPSGSPLVAAASMPLRDLDYFMAPRTGLRVLANRGTNGIDGFVSTALGVALASKAPAYALAGDLALIHDQNGLLVARSEHVEMTFVVLNNDGGGIFSFMPQADFPEHFEKLFGTPQGFDFERLAALHGFGYKRLRRARDLIEVVAAPPTGVRIVEVRTDRADNVALHERAWNAVERALSA